MPKTKNERITENFARDRFRDLGFYDDLSGITVTEQKTEIDAARKALAAASKAGGGGTGAPEFIITDPTTPDFILIVECKALVSDHSSATAAIDLLAGPADETDGDYVKRVCRYAVDGVLHYAKHLSRSYNVVGRKARSRPSSTATRSLGPAPSSTRARSG